MNRFLFPISISVILLISSLSFCHSIEAEEIFSVDAKLLNWIKINVSSKTGLPYSFQVSGDKKKVYQKTGESFSVTGIIERMIVAQGISVYDAALWQIVLTIVGGEENISKAYLPIDIYWEGRLGKLENIRAGFSQQPFVYDPQKPQAVTSVLKEKGKRGFIFRIINADGEYITKDPLDGKTKYEKFPNSSSIHWEDWKPISGENAWAVIAAVHLYTKKYKRLAKDIYIEFPSAVEIRLAEEITRAALLLQADNGGIRMAPLGTYYHLLEINETSSHESIAGQLDEYAELVQSGKNGSGVLKNIGGRDYSEYHTWYYEEISTENNLSWYAALRMLFKITYNPVYKQALSKIESYMKSVWNGENYFYQGAHFVDGNWQPNKKHFATDVQNWAIVVLGPRKIDDWFGAGSAYMIWQAIKQISGYRNEEGKISGVGFTQEHDRFSVEWSAGAIMAAREIASYYKNSHPAWASEVYEDAKIMREGIELYRKEISDSQAAYAYSSPRGWIPFGWFSHDEDVLSLASTCWMILIDTDFNPFVIR